VQSLNVTLKARRCQYTFVSQVADLGVVAREDAVSYREAGVRGDDTVIGAGDGHAGPAVVLVDPVAAPRHGGGRSGIAARVAGLLVESPELETRNAKWRSSARRLAFCVLPP